MINSSLITDQSLRVTVSGLINYITQANFTIETLKYIGGSTQPVQLANQPPKVTVSAAVRSAPYSQFAMIDVFYSTLNDIPSVFTPNQHRFRVINSENYVSESKKQIIVIYDDEMLLPSALLR
jgi:hypothetical protein